MKEARGNDLYVGEGTRSAAPDPFISSSTVPRPPTGERAGRGPWGYFFSAVTGPPPVLTGLLGHTGSDPCPSSVPEGRWN